MALDAFESGRGNGRQRTYLILPPGAGKTVLGLEIVRRLGQPALVLCPNTAVQAQWLNQWQDFLPANLVLASGDAASDAPLLVLTYQALCDLQRDDAALDERATALWRDEVAATEHLSIEQAEAVVEARTSATSSQDGKDRASFRRKVRILVARDGERDEMLGLLHPHARDLIGRLKSRAPLTLVLDECHHLLEMWGYLVRTLVEELGAETFVVGLTATPPAEMDAGEYALYRDLFGRADFEVPKPAVVKEGDLAPYQELALLTAPTEEEATYLAKQSERFEDLLGRLMDPDFGSLPFFAWLRRRVEDRRLTSGARVSWSRFEHDEPDLACAALRFFFANHIDPPLGVRFGEQHRRPPTADDWVIMIDDYCRGHLRGAADARDVAAWNTIQSALPSLGYVLTRHGIRSYVTPVDRVLSLSANKASGAATILSAEQRVLGAHLRAVVLCDYESANAAFQANLQGVLDPHAGSAALALHVLTSDPTVAELNPILVTGRTVAASRATAVTLAGWIDGQVPHLRGMLRTERLSESTGDGASPHWDDLVRLTALDSWWQPRHYVPLLTRFFEEGRSRCLVGTRGLLGEGWDAPRANVLIDLTASTTATSVHQMRGRTLRLDSRLPDKVADNWDVVCVAPEHPKGGADYDRFVRKHRHYFALTADGEIESGVSHVDPRLSPFGPPRSCDFEAINLSTLRRPEKRPLVRERWDIGEPYDNVEVSTVRVRPGRTTGITGQRVFASPKSPFRGVPVGRRAGAVALVAAVVTGTGLAVGLPPDAVVAGLGIATAGLVWIGRSVAAASRLARPSDAIEDLASAVADALGSSGGVNPGHGAKDVQLVPQTDGFYRCFLRGASAGESQLFAESLDELLAPLTAPRYIIPRYVVDPPSGLFGGTALVLRAMVNRAPGSRVVYHAVPAFLAANRDRVNAFQKAWNRYVSPGRAMYYQDRRAQAIIEAQGGNSPLDAVTQMRTLWT